MTAPLVAPGPLPVIKHLTPDAHHFYPWNGHTPRSIYGIVLHSTAGTDSRRWLSTDPASVDPVSGIGVSIPILVQRDGTRINIVDYADVAVHVGIAREPWHNSNALGIEFENRSDTLGHTQPYPAVQIETGAHALATLMYSYGVPWARVVRHGDIALPPGRRTDPIGPFPLDVLHVRAQAWLDYWAVCSEAERVRTII
jgi:N-acetyl-anhydromuramyl-L-alanine amidase AmpD